MPVLHRGTESSGVERCIERWRSFKLIMTPYYDEIYSIGDLHRIYFTKMSFGSINLRHLTSLFVRGACLVLTGSEIPSLVDLRIDRGDIIGYSNLRPVENLRWEGEGDDEFDWEGLNRL
jgi:hypothetical protein